MIPPGGEGEIKATLKTAGRQGKTTKRITVVSNDPENPNFNLTLDGEIMVDVTMNPRNLAFGQLGKGEGGSREFEIVVNEPDKVKVKEVSIEDDRFSVKKLSQEEDGKSKWELTFKGAKEIGRLALNVKIILEGSEIPEASLPIRANIVGDLQYTSSLYFNKGDEGYPERELVLTSRSGKNITIKGVNDPDGVLNLDIAQKTGKKAVIKATVKDPEMEVSKPARHKFTVLTSDPDEGEIEIRYTVSKRRAGRLPHMRTQDMKRGMGPMRKKGEPGKMPSDKMKIKENRGEEQE